MEWTFSEQREVILNSFLNVKEAIDNLYEWNKDLTDVNSLLSSSSGMQTLAADCMMIQVIGEEIKKIDQKTNGELLVLRPEIPWKNVKSMRDRISHGYFDINTDYVWDVIKNDLDPLMDAVAFFIDYLSD